MVEHGKWWFVWSARICMDVTAVAVFGKLGLGCQRSSSPQGARSSLRPHAYPRFLQAVTLALREMPPP